MIIKKSDLPSGRFFHRREKLSWGEILKGFLKAAKEELVEKRTLLLVTGVGLALATTFLLK